MSIPLEIADILIEAAEFRARSLGVPMGIAVCDGAGVLQRFTRMDRAIQASVEVAQNKAYTSALLNLPTSALPPLVQPGAELYGLQNTHQGRLVFFGGGVPLCLDGKMVAALGVSGGSVAQDMEVALGLEQAWDAMAFLASGLKANLAAPNGLAGDAARSANSTDKHINESGQLVYARQLIRGAWCLARNM